LYVFQPVAPDGTVIAGSSYPVAQFEHYFVSTLYMKCVNDLSAAFSAVAQSYAEAILSFLSLSNSVQKPLFL
jgi:hypothetical protein